jgi:DNA invertase Pin-like site-specific DNA recombinase
MKTKKKRRVVPLRDWQKKNRDLTERQKESIKRLIDKGFDSHTIAEKVGCGNAQVMGVKAKYLHPESWAK